MTPEQLASPEVQAILNDLRQRAAARGIKMPEPVARPHREAPPGYLNRAASFIGNAARHVAAGMPQVTDEEKQHRLALCVVCEHFEPTKRQCLKCGCSGKMLEWRTTWATMHCPLPQPKW